MSLNFKLDTKAFEKDIKTIVSSTPAAVKRGMERNVARLKQESQALVPEDTGELKQSVITEVRPQKDSTTGSVGYTAEHAARQNFDLSLNPGPKTVTKSSTQFGEPGPGFLTNPFKGLSDNGTFNRNVENEIDKVIKRVS